MHIVCGYSEIGEESEIDISSSISSSHNRKSGSNNCCCNDSSCSNDNSNDNRMISNSDSRISSCSLDHDCCDGFNNKCDFSSQAVGTKDSTAGTLISTILLASSIATKDSNGIDINDAITASDSSNTIGDLDEIVTTKATTGTVDYSSTPTSINEKNLVLRLTKEYHHGDKVINDELYVKEIMEPWFSSYCFQRTIVRLPSVFLRGIILDLLKAIFSN